MPGVHSPFRPVDRDLRARGISQADMDMVVRGREMGAVGTAEHRAGLRAGLQVSGYNQFVLSALA